MAKKKKTSAKKARETKAQQSTRKQMQAVVLFGVAVLMFCFAAIQGENVWTWLHNVMRGLLSFSAFLLPVALGAYAVLVALEKNNHSISARLWICVGFVVMLMSVVFTFTTDTTHKECDFKKLPYYLTVRPTYSSSPQK